MWKRMINARRISISAWGGGWFFQMRRKERCLDTKGKQRRIMPRKALICPLEKFLLLYSSQCLLLLLLWHNYSIIFMNQGYLLKRHVWKLPSLKNADLEQLRRRGWAWSSPFKNKRPCLRVEDLDLPVKKAKSEPGRVVAGMKIFLPSPQPRIPWKHSVVASGQL